MLNLYRLKMIYYKYNNIKEDIIMFFPYFKLKQMFEYLYIDMMDCPSKFNEGVCRSYTTIGNKKYSYVVSIKKSNEDTNSILGLYINVDLFEEPNKPGNTIDDIKNILSLEYFYSWTINRYRQTKSYVSTEYLCKFWKNPLRWFNAFLADILRETIGSEIEFIDFKHVFNYKESLFNEWFINKINRTITEKPKKKTTRKPKNKSSKTPTEKPRPKKQSTKPKKNIKGE